MDEFIKKIPKIGKIYKSIDEAYGALLKGFRSIKKRDPDLVENQMLKAEAKGKIKEQGDNISILDDQRKFAKLEEQGIMSQAPGTKKPIDELEDYTISDEDVVQNLVDQKFGKGYFDNVEEVSFAPGMDKRGKMVKESPSQRQADLDRPFVTEDEMSAFTLEDNARKLNKAKGFIDKLGAKSTRQKLFIADLVEDAGTGVFQDVDMGAVVRSNMFDDLIEQGIDDDLLTNIMYSGTKSDDFTTTLAKIKSNAMDEGVDINETVDFYERVFDEVARVKKSMGGRIGYAVGSLPKGIQKLVQALNKKFGKDTVKTADEIDRPKNVQAFDDFETRNPKTVESSEDIIDVDEVRKLAPQMVERFELKQRFPGLDEDLLNRILIDDNPQRKAEVIATLEESYKMLEKGMNPEDIIETFKNTSRRKNAQGGLNYLMGL